MAAALPKRASGGETIAHPDYSGVKPPPATAAPKTAGKFRHFGPIVNPVFTLTSKKSGRGLRTAPLSIRC
jgi:hypothetical protein